MKIKISEFIRKSAGTGNSPGKMPGKNHAKSGKMHHTSLVSHITAFNTRMYAASLSVSMLVILLLVTLFNIFSVAYEIKPALDRIENSFGTDSLIENVNTAAHPIFVLLNEEGEIAASSFSEAYGIANLSAWGFHRHQGKIYFNYPQSYSTASGESFKLLIYYDITLFLIGAAAIGAVSILILLVSVIAVYIRGSYLTRKAFGVVDELIVKAGNISSQNLNLRLNVSDSTDELVEIAVTFNNMMDRIEKSYKKQKQFVSDASHELRTPISVIQGYARMLERWGKDDREILQESITAIIKESKNMQDLVNKLLFIARNDKDTLVLQKNKFSMSELVNELVRDTLMLETKHQIVSHVSPDIVINGDRDQIKQALRIFVDNAIKYTEPGGTITINLEADGQYAVATVRDTGMGILEKDLPSIFDRFYRVDTAREREKGGHGLGLSIARIIVLRHGGRIKVASKVGEGTRFGIHLPLK